MIISWSFELHYDINILFLGIQQLYQKKKNHCLKKKSWNQECDNLKVKLYFRKLGLPMKYPPFVEACHLQKIKMSS